MTAVWFALAAAGGAVLRHQVNRLGTGWRGTMALNIVGAFALGLLIASEPALGTLTVLGTGFLGSLTTFSTFALEFVEAPRRIRILSLTGTLLFGLAAASLGYSLG